MQEKNPLLLNDLILREQLFPHLWEIDETAMRITVKRLLRKYKYPPDKQATAVDLIIEQAEKMCESELDK